jgi:hypothetical protein
MKRDELLNTTQTYDFVPTAVDRIYTYTQTCDDARRVFMNTIESGSLLFVEYRHKYTNNNLYHTFLIEFIDIT